MTSVSDKPSTQPSAQPSTTVVRVAVFAAGTFALPTLDALRQQQQLVGVIVPDPAEVGMKAIEVHNLIQQLEQAGVEFRIIRREHLAQSVALLQQWQANTGLIATFPHLLPQTLLDYFAFGIYNLHASPLPAYPGPAPLYWQIRNREKNTALVIHVADSRSDSGNIVVEHSFPIHPLDTVQCLGNQLAWYARDCVADLLHSIEELGGALTGHAQLRAQTSANAPEGCEYARHPTADDSAIDFSVFGAAEISAWCRAGAGQPHGPTITVRGMPVNLLQASEVDYPGYGTAPGTVVFVGDPEGLIVATANSCLRLDVLSCADGIYNGIAFAERFQLDPGMQLQASCPTRQPIQHSTRLPQSSQQPQQQSLQQSQQQSQQPSPQQSPQHAQTQPQQQR